MTDAAKTLLITGVSSGIGHGMASAYLEQGWNVLGVSRRTPHDLLGRDGFVFRALDLNDTAAMESALVSLLNAVDQLDLVVLNAGILGPFGDMGEVDVAEMQRVLDVNLWSNKRVLDHLFAAGKRIRQVVTISSGASVNGNRGWGSYSISKAALNMLTTLYSRERSETHFCALAPGLVRSEIQEQLWALPSDERYPSLDAIRKKRGTAEMPPADAAGRMLLRVIGRLPELVASGEYADVRKPPLADIGPP